MDPNAQVALIGGAFTLAGVAISEMRQRRQGRRLTQIHHQVQNSHETNLREDVDRVLTGVGTLVEGQRRQGKEIAGLREDMRVEREERLAGDKRLDVYLAGRTGTT